PVKGDIVIGEVTNAWEQRAEVTIVKRNDEYTLSPFIGEIHISDVTRRFVKSMSDVLQKGDIIRALVLNTHEIPVELSLVGPDLGVLDAMCVKCGNELTLTTYNNLICLRCENRETREVAKDYGAMFGIEIRQDLAPRRRSYDDRRRDRRDSPRDRRGGRPSRRYDGRRDGRGRGRRD
ncbi:MAG: exosome complex RNA-binding protein Csl4, partial [Candidatus Thorarchaeota archaeon]